jgi:hypothetical protein
MKDHVTRIVMFAQGKPDQFAEHSRKSRSSFHLLFYVSAVMMRQTNKEMMPPIVAAAATHLPAV